MSIAISLAIDFVFSQINPYTGMAPLGIFNFRQCFGGLWGIDVIGSESGNRKYSITGIHVMLMAYHTEETPRRAHPSMRNQK